MRFYLDSEFIEDGTTIDLISIGIVSEDGRELYLGNKDCDFSKASDWVIENVLIPMGFERMPKCKWSEGHMKPVDPTFWVSPARIKCEVAEFLGAIPSIDTSLNVSWALQEGTITPEVWADYGSYDWVALCQIFGQMIDLPNGFTMYINDIQQECRRQQFKEKDLPKQTVANHNALEDARHVKVVYEFLSNQAQINGENV